MASGGLFSFNPAAGETPETLERRRKVAEAMIASATGQPATTVGGGLAALGQAIGGRLALGRANRGIAAGQAGAADVFSRLFGGGGGAGETAALPGTEPVSGVPPTAGSTVLEGANTGLPDVARMEAYIREKAPTLGIDPDVAVRVAKAEGLQPGTWQSNVRGKGGRETSYGPFQLLAGGGLGDEFQRTTGLDLRDPNTWQQQIDFALGQAAKGGWSPWYGAAKVGVGPRTGIGGAPAVTAALAGTEPVSSADPAAVAAARGGFDFTPFATGGAAARPDSFTGLQPQMSSGLEAMISSAPPEIQKELRVMSAFRSPETQERLWQAALKKYGSASAARKWVAPPGRSQHGAGNAIDWKFASKSARDWAHKNAAQFGFSFPLSHEPWHMEVAGARGKGGPPVRQNASGIGAPLDSTGGGAGGVGVPAVAQALMMGANEEPVGGYGVAADRRIADTVGPEVMAATGLIDPAAKDDFLPVNIPDPAFRPAGGPTPYSAGATVLGGGSANVGAPSPPLPPLRPAEVPVAPPAVVPAAPVPAAAAPAPGVAPVARALGVDPLPQTSGLVGPVASAGHESLSPGAQAVTAALRGGGGADALAGGDGRGFLGRLFGPRGAPAAAPGVSPVAAALAPETAALPGTEPVAGVPAAPAAGGFSPQAMQAIAVIQNPWANEGQLAIAKSILDNEIAQADPLHRAQLAKARYDLAVSQAKDPIEIAKAKLDYDQALHPELVPPTQAEAAQIERNQAQTDLDKQQHELAKDRLRFDIEQGKVTPQTTNYDAYVEMERKRGTPEGKELTFLQYQQEIAKAGASTSKTELRLTDTAEEAEAKKRGEGSVAMFTKFTDDAPDAESFAISVNRLGQLASAIDPGTEAGLIEWFRQQTGIEIGEGADKLQAFQTMVSYLAPRMRPPGAGAASDFDARQFLGSLPSLLGTPRGNRLAVETLSGMADNRLALVHISQDYMIGAITKEEALKQMRSLPDPFAAFKEENRPDDPVPGNIDLSQKEWDMLTEDEKSDLQEGTR